MALKNQVWAKLGGLLGFHNDGDGGTFDVDAELKQAWEHCICLDVEAGSENAATNTTKSHCFYALRDMTVIGAKYVPDGTATAHNTNYATMRVFSGAGNAAATTVVANVATTPSGAANSMAAGVPFALTLQSAAVDIDAGETLAFDIVKAGTGVAVPAGHLVIYYRDR